MNDVTDSLLCCRADTTLTRQEREVLDRALRVQGLSGSVLGLYEGLGRLSTDKVQCVFVKAYRQDELLGVGIFVRTVGSKLCDSLNSRLRRRPILMALGGALRSTVYFSAHNLCSSLFSPFIVTTNDAKAATIGAILAWLRSMKDDAIIIDSSDEHERYAKVGFEGFPFASNSWIDVTDYSEIDSYYSKHKTTRKKISRSLRRSGMAVETYSGSVPDDVVRGMKASLACSRYHSKVAVPFQGLLEDGRFMTDVVTSDAYVHFVTTLDSRVAGFHSFLPCGDRLGGVMGGFDRRCMGKEPAYELTIVTALAYAIEHGYQKLCFSIVDNYTKQRMMDRFDSQNVYFHSGKTLSRSMFRHVYPYSSGRELYELEMDAIEKKRELLRRRGETHA